MFCRQGKLAAGGTHETHFPIAQASICGVYVIFK